MSGNKVNSKNTGKKSSKGKRKSAVGTVIKAFLILILTGIISLISLNLYITLSVKNRIIEDKEEFNKLTDDIDCIMVLGASVVNGEPSHMLADRLDKAIELYKGGVAGKLFMSGDNGSNDYNEIKPETFNCVSFGKSLVSLVQSKRPFTSNNCTVRMPSPHSICSISRP